MKPNDIITNIENIEKVLLGMKEVPRRKTQYDVFTVLVMEKDDREFILKTLRKLERELLINAKTGEETE